MAETIRIEVTEEDLAGGKPCHSTCCPVARAARRALPGAAFVNVSCSFLVYGPWAERKSVRLPEWVGERISQFDRGEGMAPFSFEIEVPS